MKKLDTIPLFLAAMVAFLPGLVRASPAEAPVPDQTVLLFNGRDLSGWVPVAKDGPPPAGTWQVAGGVIRCTGNPNGYLRTKGRYGNYRLTVEWRWSGPAPVESDGRRRSRNSGVLLHVQPPDTVWPKSLEAQLMESNAGDFFVIGGVETTEHARGIEQAVAAAGADVKAVENARRNRRIPKANASSEKPPGEWNTYEIVCAGDTVTVHVNGVEQNRATGVTVHEGHIGLQSEGAPIEFRNVSLESLP